MAKRSTVIWIAAPLLAMAACKGKKADTTPKNTKTSKVDPSLCDEAQRRVVTFDLNKDGRPDVWHLYDGDIETCKIDDFDHDGRKDWLVAYDAQHQPVYKKADIDYDGKYDLTEVYENGQISETERDSDFDGKLDVKEVYTEGVLSSVRRDRNADSRPDQWEQYAGGQLTAITYDDDFDGKVDRRDDHPGSAPQASNAAAPPATTAPASGPTTPAPASGSTTPPATDTTPAQPAPTTP